MYLDIFQGINKLCCDKRRNPITTFGGVLLFCLVEAVEGVAPLQHRIRLKINGLVEYKA